MLIKITRKTTTDATSIYYENNDKMHSRLYEQKLTEQHQIYLPNRQRQMQHHILLLNKQLQMQHQTTTDQLRSNFEQTKTDAHQPTTEQTTTDATSVSTSDQTTTDATSDPSSEQTTTDETSDPKLLINNDEQHQSNFRKTTKMNISSYY
ncbi:Hypothetical predicted protein [Mytilus galloprovincialis]|uniref:Uncharacterized protein n=1 Tax=Mytilus galloprovincialis TaxID=29158 RepID=A0A8B6FWC7_MYTGA|nr:Hypothetical predicted protein [Mytilus galloprovincialis]